MEISSLLDLFSFSKSGSPRLALQDCTSSPVFSIWMRFDLSLSGMRIDHSPSMRVVVSGWKLRRATGSRNKMRRGSLTASCAGRRQ
jgi:hypothetical protein